MSKYAQDIEKARLARSLAAVAGVSTLEPLDETKDVSGGGTATEASPSPPETKSEPLEKSKNEPKTNAGDETLEQPLQGSNLGSMHGTMQPSNTGSVQPSTIGRKKRAGSLAEAIGRNGQRREVVKDNVEWYPEIHARMQQAIKDQGSYGVKIRLVNAAMDEMLTKWGY